MLAAVVMAGLLTTLPAPALPPMGLTEGGDDTPVPTLPSMTASVPGECRVQAPQKFLVRGSWFPTAPSREEAAAAASMREQAVEWRTKRYGYYPGFGRADWNAHPPAHYARTTTFMGLPIQINQKVVPALACVEKALRANPSLMAYHPQGLSGLRMKNTYRGSEISNHVYGIAIDIDPDRNTCCGCVGNWKLHPLCKKPSSSEYDRMAMPRGWVETFEKYGFYWLGHDVLRDTMHFEFLGDPDRITGGG